MKIADDYAAIKQRLSEIEAEKKSAIETPSGALQVHPWGQWYEDYKAKHYENEVSTSNINFYGTDTYDLLAGLSDFC